MNIPFSGSQLIWKVADWIYPPTCAGCGRIGYRFCAECLSKTKILRESYCLSCGSNVSKHTRLCQACANESIVCTDMASWAEYKDPLRKAIHHLKYQQDVGLADFFVPFLIGVLEKFKWQFDLVIPVPTSKKRKVERGYNQAELLSRPIALYFRLPHSTGALKRVKETESQVHLSASDRYRNMEGAFYGNPAKLKGRNILIVDDIITTGATLNHCSNALFDAGAATVFGLSIAKTIRDHT